MSGGSFNYLGRHVEWCDREWMAWIEIIERMARVLEDYGPEGVAAARATRNVLTQLAIAQDAAEKLAELWNAVEWHHSGDSGREDVQASLARWQPRGGTIIGVAGQWKKFT